MPTYRAFHYPLNVFMHLLTREEGEAGHLHYGLFDVPGEPIRVAQERSTDLLLSRLPPPPARILDAGSGLGTTLARLLALGYDAEGITPDPMQVAEIRRRHGESVPVRCTSFEAMGPTAYDVVLFQESSQYIDSAALFAKAGELTRSVVVFDEFAMRPLGEEGALHQLGPFLEAAAGSGFREIERLDVSDRAAPTIDYFLERIPRHREALMADLGVTAGQLDALLESGTRYRTRYADGTYRYLLLRFAR